MKLRLPNNFLAALMAALASVSFTTLSSGTIAVAIGAALLAGQNAQAFSASELNSALAELLDLNLYIAGEDYTFSFILTTVGTGGTGSILTLASGTDNNYYFVTQNAEYGGLSKVTSDAQGGWTQTTSHEDNLNIWNVKGLLTGWISRGANGTDQTGATLNGSTITVTYSASTNTTTFELYHKEKNTTDRVVMTGVALNAEQFNFDGKTSDGTGLVFRVGKDYVWNGTDGNSIWSTSNNNWLDGEQGVALPNTGNALFTTEHGEKTVTIEGDVTANRVVVQDNYTFDLNGNTVTATVGMTVASGKTLTLDGEGTLSAGLISSLGNVSIADGSTLEMRSALTIGGTLSGAGDITYTGNNAGTVTLNANNGGADRYTGTFTNAGDGDVTLSIPNTSKGGSSHIHFNIAREQDAGKVNLAISQTSGSAAAADLHLYGTAEVNNITHFTTVTTLLHDNANVTATGTVVTGRLVVGDTTDEDKEYKNPTFTLSGTSAMLNTGGASPEYGATVQGYGTFEVADGAKQSLTGTLSNFTGTFQSTGADSELTLGNALGNGADLSATQGGKISLTSSVTGADVVNIGANSTLALASMDTNALSVNSLTLASGSTLDLSALSISGTESGPITLVRGGTIDGSNLGSVNILFDTQITQDYTLDVQSNNLVLTFTQPSDWPTGSSVRYTYTPEGQAEEVHYDIETSTAAHGYDFSKADGGVVEFNPALFTNDNDHTYTIDYTPIKLQSDTAFVVDEGNTVIFTGEVRGYDSSAGTVKTSGDLTKLGEGTLVMKLNDRAVGPQADLQNNYEGSIDVQAGTLCIVPGTNESLLASCNGDYVRVAKDAVLEMEKGVSINIPKGHRGNSREGDGKAVIIDADSKTATIRNAYISQDGISAVDEQDGGRASVEADSLRIGNIQDTSQAISIELADITVSTLVLNGRSTIDNSHIQVVGEMMDIRNSANLANRIQNNSTIEFTGYMGWVNNTDVDKTSKINSINPGTAWLMGANKIEVGSTENGGVAERTMTGNSIKYTSDQYAGMMMYGDNLSLAITLSDMDLPDDLTNYTFELIMEDFDTSAILGGTLEPIGDNLNVDVYIPAYTGGQWEEVVAGMKAMYDTTTGNTTFFFEHVVVPEPTTGTLSLLALMALAARRRRK